MQRKAMVVSGSWGPSVLRDYIKPSKFYGIGFSVFCKNDRRCGDTSVVFFSGSYECTQGSSVYLASKLALKDC